MIATPPSTASTFCHQRPVELAGAEQLGEEDQPEQRRGAVEDVGRGREALDEHRQPGAPKLPLVGGDLIAGAHAARILTVSRRSPPGTRRCTPVAREGDPHDHRCHHRRLHRPRDPRVPACRAPRGGRRRASTRPSAPDRTPPRTCPARRASSPQKPFETSRKAANTSAQKGREGRSQAPHLSVVIALLANPDSGSGEAEEVERLLARARPRGVALRSRPRRRRGRRAAAADRRRRRRRLGRLRRPRRPRGPGSRSASSPVGTANDFARALGLPEDLAEAVELAATGRRTERLDLGRVGERPFVNAASAGLSPVAAREAHGLKRALGPLAYTVGALRAGLFADPGRRPGRGRRRARLRRRRLAGDRRLHRRVRRRRRGRGRPRRRRASTWS